MSQARRVRRRRAPTTTTRSAGRTRWTRPTSGPSRWPRTGAAPATARSCTGPTESRTKAGIRNQFTPRHRRRARPFSKPPGIPQPTIVNGVHAEPDTRAPACSTRFNDAEAPERHETAVLRDVLQPRHLPQGLERGDQAPHTLADGRRRAAGLRRRRLGALRRQHRLDAGARTSRRRMPEKLHELQRLWLIEAVKYNVLPLDDRQIERINPDTGRAADADQGQHPAAVRGHGAAVREQRPQHQEQIVRRHRRAGGARRRRRGCDHRPGRPVRRLESVRQGRPGQVLLQRAGHQVRSTSRPTEPIPTGTHQVRMEFAYDGGGMGKGGDVTLYCDGKEVGKGRVDQTQGVRFLRRRDHRHRLRNRHHRQPRLHGPHQQIQRQDQLGADRPRRRRQGRRPLHRADERFRIAMARQ